MKLYLVQHADALPKAENPDRPLSQKGVADALRMAAFLDTSGVRVDEVVHSGKKRAEETANILANAVWPGHSTLEMESLGPNDSTDHLVHSADASGGDILVVAHLPFVNRCTARLLRGRKTASPSALSPARWCAWNARMKAGSSVGCCGRRWWAGPKPEPATTLAVRFR